MAISKITPYPLLLQTWQRDVDEQEWVFNQVSGAGAPLTRQCEVYIQKDRENIAKAMHDAYKLIGRYTHFNLMPEWETFGESDSTALPFRRGTPIELQQFQLPKRRVIQYGQKASTLIEAGATVTYSAATGQATATITVTSADAAVDEVQVFFKVADGALTAADPRYQITPLRVSKSGNTITITGPRNYFVKPSTIWDVEYDSTDPNFLTRNAANAANAADFVTEVDIYRIYTDTTTQALIISDPFAEWESCSYCSQYGSSIATTAVVRSVGAHDGIFQIRFKDGCSCPPVSSVERVIVYAKTGIPLALDNDIDPYWRQPLVSLANCMMKPVQLCAFSQDVQERWQVDRMPPGPQNPVSNAMATRYQFGSTQGRVEAWQAIEPFIAARGGALS